ncbi:MAG: HTH domain-containing protein [Candidatus Poribacteria bacterium]|nr:HTH domain-containing protein [Candidatus Poribacteria bacterium]
MTPKQMARLGVFQTQEAILSVLEQEPRGLKPEEISTKLGVSDRIVQGVLDKLQNEGYIEPPITERWKIVSSDRSHINRDESHVWTAEKFNNLISGEKYKELYSSKGQIKRLSELGADLMNLVEKEKWQLSHKFRKLYFALYLRRSPIFGIDLAAFSPRLCVWLPKQIVIDRENRGETNSRHEVYSNWANSIGYAVYPTGVEVTDIEKMLAFTYASRRGESDVYE